MTLSGYTGVARLSSWQRSPPPCRAAVKANLAHQARLKLSRQANN
jgi:hypothetical protein